MAAPVVSVSEKLIPAAIDLNTTALSDGSLLAVYTKTIVGGGFQIVKQFLNADGTAKTPEQVIFSRTSGEHMDPVAARLSDGRFVVAWRSDDEGLGDAFIKYQIFKANGSPDGAILTLGRGWSAQIAALANGAFAISYDGKSALFSATGVMSQNVTLSSSIHGESSIATLKNGNYVTVAKVLNDTGGSDAIAYIRKPTGEITTKTLFHSDHLDSPEVTVLSGGNFVVLWSEEIETGSILKAHLYDASGNPIGEDMPMGESTGAKAIKALANGGFALAYIKANNVDGNITKDLVVATYSESGAIVSDPTIVKAGITGSIIEPSIEVMKDGRYVVSYERGHYQIFDPRASAVSWTGSSASEQYGGTQYGDRLSGSSGDDKLYGFGGSDILSGGNGLDYLTGGTGNDKIYGGDGKDTLYGGANKDIFIFNTKLSSSNVDKIADYMVADDTIYLENKYMTKLKAGKLASSAFWKGSKAHDSSDRIIYNPTKGYLYYDADGTGSQYKQVLVATMSKSLKMASGEFYVI
jgi:serralysin